MVAALTFDQIRAFVLGLFFLAAWFYFVRMTWDRPQGLLEYLGLKMGDPVDSFWRMLAFLCFFASVGLFGRAFGRW